MGSEAQIKAAAISESALNRIRYLLIISLGIAIAFELSAAFIVIPALSMVLRFVGDGFDIKKTGARISSVGFLLILIFIVHGCWFLPMIIKTGSTKYLERTLPFLLFPLMISSTSLTQKQLTIIFKSFVVAVSVAYLLSLIAAVYHYKYSIPKWGRASDFFFHEQFTQGLFNIHPTYFSLLGCTATLLALIALSGTWRMLAMCFLTVVILLINARITLVIQLLLIFSFIVKGFSKGFSVKRLILLTASIVVMFLVMRVFSSIYDYPHRKILINMESAWQRSFAPDITDGDGGVVVRMAIWRSAMTVIRDHPLIGVGLGYEEQSLTAEYKKHNIAYLAEGGLNAHNQGLSYLIGFGIVGFALLAMIYVRLMYEAFSAKCRVYFVFIAMFACVALTESIFNRLLGISLFAFFNALIMLKLVHHDK